MPCAFTTETHRPLRDAMNEDVSQVLIEGPWTHRMVAANGARFHVAEAGGEHARSDRPPILLLHGFPEFWWAWRAQIPALAAAGHRVIAMDLRGYGASDKPPQGYDTFTLAADAAAVVRCLGERQAVVVGHGWGGWIAWAMATLQPDVTRSVASLAMPHPLVMREAMTSGAQARASGYLWSMQTPFLPERSMTRGNGTYVRRLMQNWSGDADWPPEDVVQTYAAALRLPFVAHCAAEYYRWVVRSVLRTDGRRLVHRMSQSVQVPALFAHGSADGCVLAGSIAGSAAHCRGGFTQVELPGVGHFLPEQAPQETTDLLLDWIATSA
ncbi:alpha/beta fold hydrolase [Dermacoccaceae bacterium W4C1]